MAESKYFGLYTAKVTRINDPEKRQRIKVICPKVLGGNIESAWCDPLVTVAFDNGGDFCVPHLHETVWIAFIEGNPNRPVYLGGWWQKNKTPLGGGYSDYNKIRIINYADCTLLMRNGIIDISVGNKVVTINNGKVTVFGDVLVNGNVTITGDAVIGGISFLKHTHGVIAHSTTTPPK